MINCILLGFMVGVMTCTIIVEIFKCFYDINIKKKRMDSKPE